MGGLPHGGLRRAPLRAGGRRHTPQPNRKGRQAGPPSRSARRAELTPEARLSEDLCVDSLTAVELLMILEDEFDIALPEDEVGDMKTFAELVTVVAERVDHS
ncbi:MAG: acyl carrier protein [Acidimicrobiia bacterium]|nr:acyl carrier protein [Acidimicrobiia bacterium]